MKTGIQETCHPLEGGDPGNIILLDSRLRGNDKKGDAGMTVTITMSSPRRRGSSKLVIPVKTGIQGILSF
ncbi:MAG: hypothetical protein SFT93_04035 [Rickettsiaceae bacterium]|nr:hypothetical protein [Rickettsiaceae bacterium]